MPALWPIVAYREPRIRSNNDSDKDPCSYATSMKGAEWAEDDRPSIRVAERRRAKIWRSEKDGKGKGKKNVRLDDGEELQRSIPFDEAVIRWERGEHRCPRKREQVEHDD